VLGVRKCLTAEARDEFWKVRKAGFSLLMALVGDAKPVAFVEDTAVAPERLPEFHKRFFQIVERHGVEAACYGHADVGCLHIRPIINVKTREGVDQLRGIAGEAINFVDDYCVHVALFEDALHHRLELRPVTATMRFRFSRRICG
jgi:FAD/FMN-containing dehydrogenase